MTIKRSNKIQMRSMTNNLAIRILFVTPDEARWNRLSQYLVEQSFILIGQVSQLEPVSTILQNVILDMIIFDAHLLGTAGLVQCGQILTRHPTLKIVLGVRDELSLQETALKVGVAGCIPFDLPLTAWPGLLTYINSGGAVFDQRIVQATIEPESPNDSDSSVVKVGPLRIYLNLRRVELDQKRVGLSKGEFALLACLVQNIGQIVDCNQLLDEVWHYGPDDGSAAQVRLYITRLRRKLGDDPQKPTFILTERGFGYRLRSPAQWQRAMQPA